jgi:cytidyltransferase-like protein
MNKVCQSAQIVKDSIPCGKTITLVGGTFDLLHVGHIHLLKYAKKLGDTLVVCVLSDINVRSYKSFDRPIIGEVYRADMVAALECVDYVFISNIDTSHSDILSILNPSNVVFGIDNSSKSKIIAKERERFIHSNFPNIKINYLKRFSDISISTSDLIKKIRKS